MITIKARNLDLSKVQDDIKVKDEQNFTINEMIDLIKEVENDRKTGDVRLWNPKERKPIKAEEGKHQTLVSSILSNDKKGKEEVIYVTGTVAT